jgi:hypothetical protein
MPSTVPGALPVLFFGDPFTSRVATIGINPSRQEYLSPDGHELDGAQRRFETLRSLGVSSRSSLDDIKAKVAIERMRQYFYPNRPVYSWFNGLARVLEGMGFSFRDRSAVHLDLVQEATDPVWSQLIKIDQRQAETVWRRDLTFLKKQINEFDFGAVVCTSACVLAEVTKLLPVCIKARGTVARLKWTIGTVELNHRLVVVAGWNIPLSRATGLTRDQQVQFGKLLQSEMKKVGVELM